MNQIKPVTLGLLAAAVLAAAGCTTPRTQSSTLPPGTVAMDPAQAEYNLQQVDAASRALAEQARAAEAAQAKARAKAAQAKTKADAAAQAQRNAAAKKKAERQAKLQAYEDRAKELELELKQLDVTERRAKVEGVVSDEKSRAELSRDRAQLELERTRAEIENLRSSGK